MMEFLIWRIFKNDIQKYNSKFDFIELVDFSGYYVLFTACRVD